MKEKIKSLFNKIKKIPCQKKLKKIINYLKNNKMYVYMFLSLYILDISTRIATSSIGFVKPFSLIPNLFSFLWIFFLIFVIKNTKNIYGKLIYGLFYGFHFIMFLVHNIYYSIFKIFFDFSVLSAASEGSSYFLETLKNITPWMYIVIIISIALMILTYRNFIKNKKNNYKYLLISSLVFIIIHTIIPYTLGSSTTKLEWNAWNNKRNVYNTFNDNNKSMELTGLFEYNFRNIYVTYFKKEDNSNDDSLAYLETIFTDENTHLNEYTGLFEGKNLILVQLESIDNFLVNDEVMPILSNLKRQSINFSNHFSFVNGGGSTFNSEFMVNTGYATPYSYNQNAYTFSKNNFDYSLPNLFKSVGYTVNAFHMNSSEYYSRGINYKNFGYNSYNGLKDLGIYENKEYYLDTELLLNEEFNSKIFNMENPLNQNFVSYIITYSAHLPFSKTSGVCSMLLTEEEKNNPDYNPSELDCLKIQAGETDRMVGLLMDNLKEKGLYDNTVVVFFADHYVYTVSDKSILSSYKDTETNLINQTDFFIWSSDIKPTTITKATSQLNILPTLLNLFNLYDHPSYYVGEDALDDSYSGYVFFNDYTWYDGKRYVDASGNVVKGLQATDDYINNMAIKINELIKKNDQVLKTNYFKILKNKKTINS